MKGIQVIHMKLLYNNSKLLVDVNHGINNVNNTISNINLVHKNIVLDRLFKNSSSVIYHNDVFNYILRDIGDNWMDVLCDALRLYRINYIINKDYPAKDICYASAYKGCISMFNKTFFNIILNKYGINDILLDLVKVIYVELYDLYIKKENNMLCSFYKKYDYIDTCSNKVYQLTKKYGSVKKYLSTMLDKLHHEAKLLLALQCDNIALKTVYNYANENLCNCMLPYCDYSLGSSDTLSLKILVDMMSKYDSSISYSVTNINNEQVLYDCINSIDYTTVKPVIVDNKELHVSDMVQNDHVVIDYECNHVSIVSIKCDEVQCSLLLHESNYIGSYKLGVLALKSKRYDYLRLLLFYKYHMDNDKYTPNDKRFYMDDVIRMYKLNNIIS